MTYTFRQTHLDSDEKFVWYKLKFKKKKVSFIDVYIPDKMLTPNLILALNFV